MASRNELEKWFQEADSSLTQDTTNKIISEMLKDGELEKKNNLYYITEKGFFELMYGKYKDFDYRV